ncbi:phosphatidyl synthase [Aspergillus eucalypticola CBS 122712]|uniref:Phosphatidyl synthase n=1 Tax=Aspergillus eucalypticola (strain CBS 122712 / IBT 29274) TaxID=1448314 RepID=A0A317UTY2_ASPEC|nr:phosphatidyl synthase [Aspergillus eucalypticola CBS 122712]PWY64578.1 phosphatidyl synthase [Aspergillus eucalypticola CBS 122712]
MTTADGYATPRVSRLSSLDASQADLFGGPSVVVPPKHLMASTISHETAMELEAAKQHFDEEVSSEEGSPRVAPPVTKKALTTADDFALAFDIDGVLIRGGKAIPEAASALRYINGENPYGIKVPYIFVTNGGGKTEEERCVDLSRQLELEVSPGQFICGHTPMREMAERYHTVLVVGGEGEKCRIVAEGYGFKDVITPGDIIKTRQDTTPFRKLTDEEYKNSRVRDFSKTKIEAIFVFADSRDWAGDQQIILDVLMSKNGHLDTRSDSFDEGPPVYFSHNDVVWSTSHEHVRIGMGALRASLEALYKAVTGKELNTIAFGKPQLGTYQFATRLLRQWRKNTHAINKPPSTVYFVGDTPESDIRGTNEFNETSDADWFSILVKTGVYQEGTIPRYPPKKTCNHILDAVKFAIDREMAKEKKDGSAFVDDVDSELELEAGLLPN